MIDDGLKKKWSEASKQARREWTNDQSINDFMNERTNEITNEGRKEWMNGMHAELFTYFFIYFHNHVLTTATWIQQVNKVIDSWRNWQYQYISIK